MSSDDLAGLLDAISQGHEHAQALEKLALRLALVVAYMHQGKEDAAEKVLSDVRVLGKHPYDLTPLEIAFLEDVVRVAE